MFVTVEFPLIPQSLTIPYTQHISSWQLHPNTRKVTYDVDY